MRCCFQRPTLSNYPALSIHQTVSPREMVGLTRFELVTPRLSSVCSNQLSYRPRYSRGPVSPDPVQRTVAGSLKTRQNVHHSQPYADRPTAGRTPLNARSILE